MNTPDWTSRGGSWGQGLAKADKQKPFWVTAWQQGGLQHSCSATIAQPANATEEDLLVSTGKRETPPALKGQREGCCDPQKNIRNGPSICAALCSACSP